MDFLRRKACPPQAGANTTATAKNHCTLFYSRDKDRSSSRRCGNEDIVRIERRGCVCPVHPQKFILRIARIIRPEPAWTPQGAQFFPQPPHLLHRMSTALCAGFQHSGRTGFSLSPLIFDRDTSDKPDRLKPVLLASKKNAPTKIGAFGKIRKTQKIRSPE